MVSFLSFTRLYYKEHLSQKEIAERLERLKDAERLVHVRTIRHHFREQNWKIRKRSTDLGKYGHINMDEVRRLYFDEKMNQSEVAKGLGIPKYIVSEIFKENNWNYREFRVHATEEERILARKENRKNTQLKVVEMREKLFGNKCQICTSERILAIHRKDGAEHNPDDLWKVNYLKTVNPDEYAAVCVPCHNGVHWRMKTYGQNWEQIKSEADMKPRFELKTRKSLELPDETVPSSQAYQKIKPGFEGNEGELRRAIFGENCQVCGARYDEKQLYLHRMDGRPHHSDLTFKEKYFRTLEPNEWVFLCFRDHRGVHWELNNFGNRWDVLKRKLDSGAEGEI